MIMPTVLSVLILSLLHLYDTAAVRVAPPPVASRVHQTAAAAATKFRSYHQGQHGHLQADSMAAGQMQQMHHRQPQPDKESSKLEKAAEEPAGTIDYYYDRMFLGWKPPISPSGFMTALVLVVFIPLFLATMWAIKAGRDPADGHTPIPMSTLQKVFGVLLVLWAVVCFFHSADFTSALSLPSQAVTVLLVVFVLIFIFAIAMIYVNKADNREEEEVRRILIGTNARASQQQQQQPPGPSAYFSSIPPPSQMGKPPQDDSRLSKQVTFRPGTTFPPPASRPRHSQTIL
ncbi:unnamed protein product [Vitrella brassicaformis CCMP3155]|uniref:TRP C-terminal domain-containing protein n=1 Tax=Vitrella brassicaformis (strain CCMP3155) TaxID=1169540 RepID=A0A0G4H6N0_VITBC|nr:unnamed protein product [Vitrella brassicaformis CCMP3155]|mmetsp:Transcript_32663/g.94465  ORF Transcript_32663/g.94465 Transcript_32663/m.94465 type:complete len:288 (+) Transcript_32663:182-1045(+)|eukprot:CEM39406.1 unnamed protein product [Vitrella brassicaformis CCMP3155]